jgi:hypothetical protein
VVSVKRPKRFVETTEYASFARRIIRAYAKRVADADEVDLAQMRAVRDEMDAAIGEAARALAERNSWAYVGMGLGMTRQAAWQAYGRGRSGAGQARRSDQCAS